RHPGSARRLRVRTFGNLSGLANLIIPSSAFHDSAARFAVDSRLAALFNSTMTISRYYAACCQTDFPNPRSGAEIGGHVDTMIAMIARAVLGYEPFFPVKLVVFPEFAHAAPIYHTVDELIDRLAVPIPNEHTERYQHKAKQHGICIQTGSFLEKD